MGSRARAVHDEALRAGRRERIGRAADTYDLRAPADSHQAQANSENVGALVITTLTCWRRRRKVSPMPIRPRSPSPRQLRIREARHNRRISIDQLALATGIERTRIWRGERGFIELPELELDAIEAVIGPVKP